MNYLIVRRKIISPYYDINVVLKMMIEIVVRKG
jgi:hypothetical protein